MSDALSDDERREWFREHWQRGVAFNRLCQIDVLRWDPEAVHIRLPFDERLSAHEGLFHGGVIAALIDTCGSGSVIAGHDFRKGSRASTVSMSVQYVGTAPSQDVVARGRCTRRGRRLHFAEVTVEAADGRLIAQGLVTIMIAGERTAPSSVPA